MYFIEIISQKMLFNIFGALFKQTVSVSRVNFSVSFVVLHCSVIANMPIKEISQYKPLPRSIEHKFSSELDAHRNPSSSHSLTVTSIRLKMNSLSFFSDGK